MKTEASVQTVTPDEIARRLADYRRLAFERRLPAQVVYQGPHCFCPWPDCAYRIDGIHFQLEQWAEKAILDRLIDAWWRGPGLVGRCPGCDRPVLFSLTTKTAVADPGAFPGAVLPVDWQDKARLVGRSG